MSIYGEKDLKNGVAEKAAWCKYFFILFIDKYFYSKFLFSFDGSTWSRLKDGAGTEYEHNGLYNYRGYPFAIAPRINPEVYEFDTAKNNGEGQWRGRARFPFVEYSDGLRHF